MDATQIVDRWNWLDSQRSSVKSLVQQVMEYCLPRRATVTVKRTEGEDLHRELFDSTAELATQRFAAGIYDYMWNPARANFMLLPPIETGSRDVAGPLGQISETIRSEMGQSNFEQAFYEIGQDWGTAGLATLEVARGVDSLYEFSAHPFEQIVFGENSRGRADLVLRKFGWTARQIVEEFGQGRDRVGEAVWSAYQQEGGRGQDQIFDVVHAAMPRTAVATGARDVLNMPVESTWVAAADKVELRRGGWPEMRYLVSRWSKAAGEKHGRSPGMMALPDVKMINQIEECLIVGAEQVVRPPILNPNNALAPEADGKVRFKPGSILNYRVSAAAPNAEPKAFNSGARVDFGHEYAESKRSIVKEVFFNDLFLVLGDQKRRTATEVRTLLAEKLALLAPAFGRIKVELFDPMIRILLSILAEDPRRLRGMPLEYLKFSNIRYISTLAIAMEYAELSLIEDAQVYLSSLGELDPTIFDNLSFDEITRGFLQKMAWPAKWMRSRGEVKAIRQARQQYQAAQVQAQMAEQQRMQMVQMTKRPESGSPAQAVLSEAA